LEVISHAERISGELNVCIRSTLLPVLVGHHIMST
jgi:hypothetical protein